MIVEGNEDAAAVEQGGREDFIRQIFGFEVKEPSHVHFSAALPVIDTDN